jgi:uncharacterized protein YbcV (DUF1398 family)
MQFENARKKCDKNSKNRTKIRQKRKTRAKIRQNANLFFKSLSRHDFLNFLFLTRCGISLFFEKMRKFFRRTLQKVDRCNHTSDRKLLSTSQQHALVLLEAQQAG